MAETGITSDNREAERLVKRMRVLLCGPSQSAVGGVPTHIRGLLSSKLSERYDITHFEVGSRGRESPSSEETVAAMIGRLVWSPFALIGLIVRVRPWIVHLNTTFDHKAFWRDLVYMFIAKALNRKVVLQIHGGSFETVCLANKYLTPICRNVLRAADAVVVLASIEKKELEGFTEYKILVVIPNAIDTKSFGSRQHKATSMRRIGYLGRLTRDKGLFEIVDAIELLLRKAEFGSIEILIAGSGPARGELLQYIRNKHLESRITLVGPVFGEEKIRFLKELDVFVMVSHHEGLPYSILESLAAGTPIVASSVGGIPDAILDGVHGYLVRPCDPRGIAEAIEKILVNSAQHTQMSANCLERAANNYSLERLADEFADLYMRITKQNN